MSLPTVVIVIEELHEMRSAGAELAAAFDPDLVTVGDAALIRDEAAALARIFTAMTARAAARAAQSGSWRSAGQRSAAHELAQVTGTSVGDAIRTLETGRRLEELPEVAAAAAAGELSAAQLAEVTEAAMAAPEATGGLLDKARSVSLGELQQECRRVKAATAEEQAEARRARAHVRRSLRAWTDSDGVGHLHLSDAPEITADVLAAVRAEAARRCTPADTTRQEAADADALVALITNVPATNADSEEVAVERPVRSRRADAKILVRVDFDALLRGYPTHGEVCEVAGLGPLPVSAVRDLITSGDPFLAAIATRGQQVCGVAHLGRRPTAVQDSALEWLYPECAREGCTRSTRLERNHRVRWADSKVTLVELMDLLCQDDHQLHTHRGWALVAGTGKRPMVPPEDPRHPRYTVVAQAIPRPPPLRH